jgi:hypothetical protein
MEENTAMEAMLATLLLVISYVTLQKCHLF